MPDPVLIKGLTEVPVAEVSTSLRRLRPTSPTVVDALAVSMEADGLLAPILVRKVAHKKGKLVLIAGAHRLAAAGKLGWEVIPAKVFKCNDDQARALEIDENLQRREMDPLDLAVALSERKEIYEAEHPERRKGHAGANARHSATVNLTVAPFAAIAADQLDVSESSIFRLVRAGDAIRSAGPEKFRVSEVRPTLGELTTYAKQPEDARAKIAAALADGSVKTIAEAIAALAPSTKPTSSPDDRLVDGWGRLSPEARRGMVERLYDELAPLVDEIRRARGDHA